MATVKAKRPTTPATIARGNADPTTNIAYARKRPKMHNNDSYPIFDTSACNRVCDDVLIERVEQHRNWGNQSGHSNATWLAILTEEVGESAQAVLHNRFGGKHRGTLREELVQVAAVAVAWIEAIDERGENDVV